MATVVSAPESWEDIGESLSFSRNSLPRPGEPLLAMLRAAHHLVNCKTEADLMQAVLNDAAAVLNAQFGAVALFDGETRWQTSAVVGELRKPPYFSEKLADRCF